MSARKTAVGFAAIAAVAGSLYAASLTAAATPATTTATALVNCRINPVDVEKGVQIYTSGTRLMVATGAPSSPQPFLTVKSTTKQWAFSSLCHDTKRRSPLGPNGFPSTHASPVDCAAPAHVILRLVLTEDGSGFPKSLKLEVTQGHWNFKPLAYIEWTPDGATTYMRPHSCAPR